MDPLSISAGIIAVLQVTSKFIAVLNDVKDAPKDRKLCRAEIRNLENLLVQLQDEIQDGDSACAWNAAVQDLAVENGPFDQFQAALEMLHTQLVDGGRLWRIANTLTWNIKKEEVDNILSRVERLKTLIQIALQMDHFHLSKAIHADTVIIRAHVTTMQSGVDEIQQEQNRARLGQLLEWISTTDYPSQQSDILKRKQEDTGEWFLVSKEFKGWLADAKSTLFCPGIPGAGKTMIAAIAIDHLSQTVARKRCGMAYVYCNHKSREQQDLDSMLAAILKQLIHSRIPMAECIQRLQERYEAKRTKLNSDELMSNLRNVIAQYKTVHIVIDALDECRNDDRTRSRFLEELDNLKTIGDVRLMATSRSLPEIVAAFRAASTLEVRASPEDVKRFVAGQIPLLPQCVRKSADLQELLQQKVVEAVDGMFLLARLHVDSLTDKFSTKQVKSALAKLPQGSNKIDIAYEQALERIDSQRPGHVELAKKILSWVVYAKRPLTTRELCCALTVEPGDSKLDISNEPNIDDMVSVCAGLVVVDEESSIVRLVHYTTQDFLERISTEWFPDAELHIATVATIA